MERIEHPFPPVVDENCRILILGSFPSVKSREDGFFYGHPQNRFWRMLAAIFDEEIPGSVAEKKALLLRSLLFLSADDGENNAFMTKLCGLSVLHHCMW